MCFRMAGDIDKSCKVENNSGKDVVVIDVYNSATNTAHNNPRQGYGGRSSRPCPRQAETRP